MLYFYVDMGRMMLYFCLIFSLLLAVLPHVIWLISQLIARCFGRFVRYAPFGWTALGLVILFLLTMGYGYYIGRWWIHEDGFIYENRDIPAAFNGFRIVHISDLHLSTFDSRPEFLSEIVETINAQNPDIVCFTGDIVTVGVSEAQKHTDILRKLKSRYGVFSVLGNHDFMIYGRRFGENDRAEEVEKLALYQRDTLGWHLLRNDSERIVADDGSYITILGVDNKSCLKQFFHSTDTGDLSKAMEGTDGFRILLTHDPSHWDAEVVTSTDIPLTLSGHTHAAQVRLFGWTPASWFFKRTDGAYHVGSQTLYINTGIGCTAPFRLGVRPEITTIELSRLNVSDK